MGDRTGGKTVVVTGGNAGLGYECAKATAASDRGWRVVLAVRGPEKGELGDPVKIVRALLTRLSGD